jgi:uncharacterized protein YhbP (UPF0306 family)
MADPTLEEEIGAFVRAQHVMSLATAADGAAHAASLMYATEGWSIYWTSDPSARHSLALERLPRAAATVAPDYEDFRLIRGLQIVGNARRLNASVEAGRARELLRERFPFLRRAGALPLALREALERSAFYVLEPETITLIDNRRGFGNKRTLHIA